MGGTDTRATARSMCRIFAKTGTDTTIDVPLLDNSRLILGTGDDVYMVWDGTNLLLVPSTDDYLIEIADAAATQKSFDLKWYGNSAAGADFLYFDASANLIYSTGIDLQFKDNDYLVFGTGAGASGDVSILWDATNLVINAAADDSLIEIGDSAATQKSFDLKWYGNAANGADFLYLDASANLAYTTGVDLQFKDNDFLVFGTGAGAAGDVSIVWDTTNLIVAAVADDTLIEIGDAAATQLSFDVKVYGDTANGAAYMLWDASANSLLLVGSSKVALGSSGTPQAFLYTDKALAVYNTCESVNASTSFEPILFNTVMTGAGQVGGRVRVNMQTNVALGGWANAFKASVDCQTSGRATGLLSVSCHEITMPASAGGAGTYAVIEAEIVCPASWAGTNNVDVFYIAASGATVANFDDYGYLFDLTGVTSGAAHIWYDNQKAAPAVEEFIRVKTPAGDRFLGLYNANA